MKIAYTDENGAVIPPVPELLPEKEIQPVEDTTTWGILKSGWGIFLAVVGVVSVVLDVASPSVQTNIGSVLIFGSGSMTLGWLFIVGAFVLPAAILRQFSKKPCNPVVAVMWCAFLLVVWIVAHAASDPSRPARPNLALFGGIVLCWRLLVKPRQAPSQPEIEETPAAEQAVKETTNSLPVIQNSPSKVSLKEERKIKTSSVAQQAATPAAHFTERASDVKKRVLIGGLFVICASVAIYALNKNDPPSLNWTAVLCGIWSAGIWQVPARFFTVQKFCIPWFKRIAILSAVVALTSTFVVFFMNRPKSGASYFTDNGWVIIKLNGQDYVSAESIRDYYNPVYGFTTCRLEGAHLSLGSPKLILKAKIGSNETLINNIKINLKFPVEEFSGKAFFSRFDLFKIIDPVLYPSHIQNSEQFDTVVIDASHGGKDAGAVGLHGSEKIFALQTALTLRNALQDRGLKVVMTRTTDIFVSQEDRMNIANATPKSIFISLHFNTGNKEEKGIETIPLEPQESTDSFPQHGSSIALAVAVHASVISRFKFDDLGVKCAQMEPFHEYKRPGILFKGGFVSNDKECLLIASETYRLNISNAIADAVVNYRKAVESSMNQPRQ